MDTLTQLDKSMEIIATIADRLEQQAGPCPVARLRLVTWVTNQFADVQALEKAGRDLPRLPSELLMDYMAWIHSVGKQAQRD
jgi:hypothetical protein